MAAAAEREAGYVRAVVMAANRTPGIRFSNAYRRFVTDKHNGRAEGLLLSGALGHQSADATHVSFDNNTGRQRAGIGDPLDHLNHIQKVGGFSNEPDRATHVVQSPSSKALSRDALRSLSSQPTLACTACDYCGSPARNGRLRSEPRPCTFCRVPRKPFPWLA